MQEISYIDIELDLLTTRVQQNETDIQGMVEGSKPFEAIKFVNTELDEKNRRL